MCNIANAGDGCEALRRAGRGAVFAFHRDAVFGAEICNCHPILEDLGAMIALAVGNPKADGQIFNCVHNKGITHDGMVRLCAKVMGVDCPPIIHYDPEKVGGKKAFLFRPMHFYAQPVAATSILGWVPKVCATTMPRRHSYRNFAWCLF